MTQSSDIPSVVYIWSLSQNIYTTMTCTDLCCSGENLAAKSRRPFITYTGSMTSGCVSEQLSLLCVRCTSAESMNVIYHG
jgi:hypothetical protein